MNSLAYPNLKINPCENGVPAFAHIPQVGTDLVTRPTPNAATRSDARRHELAAGKLMQYHFARMVVAGRLSETLPIFEVREGAGGPKYTITTIKTPAGEAPHTCHCEFFRTRPAGSKYCSHTDALYWLLEQARAGETIKSSAPAPFSPCSNDECLSPCVMVRVAVGERGERTRQICSKSVTGECDWKKAA